MANHEFKTAAAKLLAQHSSPAEVQPAPQALVKQEAAVAPPVVLPVQEVLPVPQAPVKQEAAVVPPPVVLPVQEVQPAPQAPIKQEAAVVPPPVVLPVQEVQPAPQAPIKQEASVVPPPVALPRQEVQPAPQAPVKQEAGVVPPPVVLPRQEVQTAYCPNSSAVDRKRIVLLGMKNPIVFVPVLLSTAIMVWFVPPTRFGMAGNIGFGILAGIWLGFLGVIIKREIRR